MSDCITDKRLGQLSTLSANEALSLYLDYRLQVQSNVLCANTDHYVAFHLALDRTHEDTMSNEALGLAFLSSLRPQSFNSKGFQLYSKMWVQGVPDKPAVLAQIRDNQSIKSPEKRERDWNDIDCISDTSRCAAEADAAREPLYSHIKRYVYQTFLAHFATYECVQITVWLVHSLSVAAWKKDPRILVDILEHFIETKKIALKDEEGKRIGNMLIVLRDLLKATSERKESEWVQLPEETLKKYMGSDELPIRGVGQAVDAYLRFLTCLSDTALPDLSLMKALTALGDNKRLSKEVESRVMEKVKALKKAGGKK